MFKIIKDENIKDSHSSFYKSNQKIIQYLIEKNFDIINDSDVILLFKKQKEVLFFEVIPRDSDFDNVIYLIRKLITKKINPINPLIPSHILYKLEEENKKEVEVEVDGDIHTYINDSLLDCEIVDKNFLIENKDNYVFKNMNILSNRVISLDSMEEIIDFIIHNPESFKKITENHNKFVYKFKNFFDKDIFTQYVLWFNGDMEEYKSFFLEMSDLEKEKCLKSGLSKYVVNPLLEVKQVDEYLKKVVKNIADLFKKDSIHVLKTVNMKNFNIIKDLINEVSQEDLQLHKEVLEKPYPFLYDMRNYFIERKYQKNLIIDLEKFKTFIGEKQVFMKKIYLSQLISMFYINFYEKIVKSEHISLEIKCDINLVEISITSNNNEVEEFKTDIYENLVMEYIIDLLNNDILEKQMDSFIFLSNKKLPYKNLIEVFKEHMNLIFKEKMLSLKIENKNYLVEKNRKI